MKTYQHILVEVGADRVCQITLNRPRYRNVQGIVLLNELDHAIAAADADRAVHVIVLRGAGDHFSAGHDLGTPEELAYRAEHPLGEGTAGFFVHTWHHYVDLHLRWRNVGKPMIAAVQGYCIFGGWMVASTADILFAAEDAKFLGNAFQYFAIPWDISPRRAKEMLFEGRFIGPHEAKELGFVNQVVPTGRLLEATLEYARDVADNDPFDMRMTKLAINQAQNAQGFENHIKAAHSFYMIRRTSDRERGPDRAPGKRRLPKVQAAMDRFERRHNQKPAT
jgi:enoyl-CoA hydratase